MSLMNVSDVHIEAVCGLCDAESGRLADANADHCSVSVFTSARALLAERGWKCLGDKSDKKSRDVCAECVKAVVKIVVDES